MKTTLLSREQVQSTIDELIECAIKWASADADNPDTPSPEWQQVIPLLKAAPALHADLKDGIEHAQAVVDTWETGNLADAVRALRAWMETTHATPTITAQLTPPDGHRLLTEGEIIYAGDLWLHDRQWLPTNNTGARWNPRGFRAMARKTTN